MPHFLQFTFFTVYLILLYFFSIDIASLYSSKNIMLKKATVMGYAIGTRTINRTRDSVDFFETIEIIIDKMKYNMTINYFYWLQFILRVFAKGMQNKINSD